MRVAILLSIIAISGCTTVPVTVKFPEAPNALLETCPELVQLSPDAKLSDVARTVVENYTRYHQCSNKQESWIEWYNTQKKIFEGVQ